MLFYQFVFFSSLEYISSFLLLFALFRFEMKKYVPKILLSALIMSFLSHTISTENLIALSPIIQALFFIFLISVIANVSFFSASIMGITTYILFVLMQLLVVAFSMYFGITDAKPEANTPDGFMTQLMTAVLITLLALIIKRTNTGFSFIGHRSKFKKNDGPTKPINRLFVYFGLLAIIIITTANYLMLSESVPPYIDLILLVLATLVLGLYLSTRKDHQNG